MTSKADPTKAISEVQPVAVALEKSTMESIRSIQHRDANGDIILDPDRSNPTRPRFERPLDTIRAFEAAIDMAYTRRPFTRAGTAKEADHMGPQNRRGSYYQGHTPRQRQQTESGGYYGNRVSPVRPDSLIENYGAPPNQYIGSRRFSQRVNSDTALSGQTHQNGYPPYAYQQSLDTGGSSSANESNGTDQWGNSTDPSSENSSIDKAQQPVKPDLGEIYGFNGFGGAPQFQGPILEEHSRGAPAYGQPGYGHSQGTTGLYQYQGKGAANELPPPPPPHAPPKENIPRVPIKLGGSTGPSYTSPGSTGEKRKSWLKRRFNKA